MNISLYETYKSWVLKKPNLVLFILAIIVSFFAYHTSKFQLDASADSLLLENDKSLEYYRSISARYASDDYLIITYTPKEADMFDDSVLATIKELRDQLKKIERVKSVTTILDVPLISSPPVSLKELQEEIRTLSTHDVNKELVKKELTTSPLYSNLLISKDAGTTAIVVNFESDETYHGLLQARNSLRSKKLSEDLSKKEKNALKKAEDAFDIYAKTLRKQQDEDIQSVRDIIKRYKDNARIHLGGVPMIVADSIEFIRKDLRSFGVGVLCFIIVILSVAFRKKRWIITPILTCSAVAITMIGFLGLVGWPVTVVSSNFISLLLIITLSLNVHLIVRYRELHRKEPNASQYTLVRQTIKQMASPCFYTAITTIVGFGSLMVSGIRPIIDFGWMMTFGIAVAFLYAFTLFPAIIVQLKPTKPIEEKDITGQITAFFAHTIHARSITVLICFAIMFGLSVFGMTMLTVENRFIDYYKENTEIYQGMQLIDQELGGTTPLDVIIDAPQSFLEVDNNDDFAEEDEEFGYDYGGYEYLEEPTNYWYSTFMLKDIEAMHNYLNELPESGKVISLHTAMETIKNLKGQGPIDSFFLSVLLKKVPEDLKKILFTPYLSKDGNQLRYSIRVFESDPSLRRQQLIDKIKRDIPAKFNLEDEQVKVTGMLVLYNNLLQSLFRSQILTLGIVFLAIMGMFAVSFKSIKMASIAIIPNMVAAFLVLGLMGWLNIPLDIMTITIAAIVIGIAVDNTIHYVHRVSYEYKHDHNYWAAVKRSHGTIGRAMYYTAITITLGFSILALSNFVPTIYFGLLTGISMMVALLADIALLPLLIVFLKPFGKNKKV